MMVTLFIILFMAVSYSAPTCKEVGAPQCNVVCRQNKTNPFIEEIPLRSETAKQVSSPTAVKCENSMNHYGPYKYKCDRVKYPMTPGFICGLPTDGDPNAYICYPTDTSLNNLPITSFIHGFGAGGNGMEGDYRGLFETWASWGIITVAPESCKNGGCDKLFYDQETAILEAQQLGTSLHSIFGRVNFSKVAISGHSMGGTITQMTSGQWLNNDMYNNFTAKCAVILHNGVVCPKCQCNDMMTMPSMWTTGTKDGISHDSDVIECFNKETNKNVFPKVIADLKGATHFEPNDNNGGHLAPYMAQFMLCILNNDPTACNYVYGTDKTSLCQACEYGTCKVDKSP